MAADLEAVLNDDCGTNLNEKRFGIDVWISSERIIPRAPGIWMLYPRVDFDVFPNPS